MRAEDPGRDGEAHLGGVSGCDPGETDAAALRAAFDGEGPLTVGVEEEILTLDPASLDLAPLAGAVVAAAGAPGVVKGELPAAQLETVTDPAPSAALVAADLARRRALVARACDELARPAAIAVHPFADPLGRLSDAPRYAATVAEYGEVARLQLVSGLHLHVRVPGADRALAVHDALRSYLPELAALAAAAPFLAGRDTGMASVRPKISELLPRQGVPPALGSWERHAAGLRWGRVSGSFPMARLWWWELRPHPVFGTLELRVADQQPTVRESAALAAVAQALVGWLAERHDAGEPLAVHPTWRIEQNRWSAARHGLTGTLADLDSGEPRPTASRVLTLLDEVGPIAERLGGGPLVEDAAAMARAGGAAARLRAAAAGDPRRAAAWLADRFGDGIGLEVPPPGNHLA